jgi:hypothetical protein
MAELSKRELAFLERLIQRAMNRGDPEAAALLEEQRAVAMHDLSLLCDELERIVPTSGAFPIWARGGAYAGGSPGPVLMVGACGTEARLTPIQRCLVPNPREGGAERRTGPGPVG